MLQHNNHVHEGGLQSFVGVLMYKTPRKTPRFRGVFHVIREVKRTKTYETPTETIATQASFKGEVSPGFWPFLMKMVRQRLHLVTK